MTACAIETAADGGGTARPTAFTIAADRSYAARLAPGEESDGWFPERWTLGGPEPYAVQLPGSRPEEPDSELLPLADGRVLIGRRAAGRYGFALLYPTGPGTGELPLGDIACERLTLLPPAPDGCAAYALAPGEKSSTLWRVHGAGYGPEPVAELPGHCSGGVWLDRTGRLLSVDQELDGRTKSVTVDLRRGGETTPLLQITEDSNDRLLLADPDSGLLLLRSDAPGQDRLGWGVLGSQRPVRFPECLRIAEAAVSPFAVQPGQMLMPETCAVALRIDTAAATWVGVWRPSERRLWQLRAPVGWLAGAGLWTAGGELRLPYTTKEVPCGLARATVPEPAQHAHAARASAPPSPHKPARPAEPAPGSEPARPPEHAQESEPVQASEPARPSEHPEPREAGRTAAAGTPIAGSGAGAATGSGGGSAPESPQPARVSPQPAQAFPHPAHAELTDPEPGAGPGQSAGCRPVPLQQAPLAARQAT